MMTYQFDVLYLGSGHGTFDGAIPLAAKGLRVGVIEANKIGGTCPNYGCNAKILLDAPVQLQREFERLNGHGISGQVQIDWAADVKHKDMVIQDLPAMIAGGLREQGVEIIHGHGRFVDAHTVTVDGKEYTAEKIVIATGLRPKPLTIEGQAYVHDSTDFMALDHMPDKLVIIGSGYIALEFATIANAAGAQVTVLFNHEAGLKQFHQPYVELVLSDLIQRGVTIVRDVKTQAIQSQADHLIVVTNQSTYAADWILNATGRIPNTDELGLAAIGVQTTEQGIVVNDHLQTTVANIYASGDVLDKKQPKLTPTAIFESLYLMRQFAGMTDQAIDYPVIPTVVFTSPRIAQAGISVSEAQAMPTKYEIKRNKISDSWYRQVTQETVGESTLIFDRESGHLVGAIEVSAQADDVINTLLPAIEFDYTAEQLNRLVPLFPSITSDALGML
ncbi:NAD(P)/FAD-dependent oxidoreductase [Weissella diestrammenae]|uniref:NAD(P)/FAD-dependent oxidoreductase n=2 Tax=Weissella diestrammenae TaxID=1162633 RepID=A0A7G9T3G3_9LACO|nr:NAD(P)/FAD-dependent oxidoreductase [Weissella diestrammenae]MCM0582095.1 NAD(P)/FAD-dependent oxidoreductase [Weissella diestrammenae]QNN74638.1 NAD(P)/FAD-dependent oxidoreductase [Weissella diestrammenae]